MRSVRRPRDSIAAATSSMSGARRAVATTSAPASARPSARTRPIPLVPPTTTTTRPLRSKRFRDMTRPQVSMSHMLRDTLYRHPRRDGLHLLQRRCAGGARELTTWRLRLAGGATEQYSAPGEESILVMQSGAGSAAVGGEAFPISRTDVFEQRASAVYVPAGEIATVSAAADLEAILVSTPADPGRRSAFVGPGDVAVTARGRGAYARDVHDIFVTDNHAQRLM